MRYVRDPVLVQSLVPPVLFEHAQVPDPEFHASTWSFEHPPMRRSPKPVTSNPEFEEVATVVPEVTTSTSNVIDPDPFVIDNALDPAVNAANEYPDPFPIKRVPFAAAEPSIPVPPRETLRYASLPKELTPLQYATCPNVPVPERPAEKLVHSHTFVASFHASPCPFAHPCKSETWFDDTPPNSNPEFDDTDPAPSADESKEREMVGVAPSDPEPETEIPFPPERVAT